MKAVAYGKDTKEYLNKKNLNIVTFPKRQLYYNLLSV